MPAGVATVAAFSNILLLAKPLQFFLCTRNTDILPGVVFPEVVVAHGTITASAIRDWTLFARMIKKKSGFLIAAS